MAIVINGSGTVTGLAVGGLPDGTVDAGTLATNSVDSAEIVDGSVDRSKLNTSITDSGNATAITIDSSENVGIGTTPAAWSTTHSSLPINTLQLGSHTSLVNWDGKSSSLATSCYLSAGQPYNGTWKYSANYTANQLMIDSGEYFFRTADSGTAGNTISWNTPLIIKNDGRGLSQFTAKAWVNFNAAQAIQDSHNVSSITDNGTGHYTINYTNNLANDSQGKAFSADVSGWNTGAVQVAGNNVASTQIKVWNRSDALADGAVSGIVFGD
tara:strand:+ start:1259 stop:2065 length:807 start_codon:yes stop_codon:yes gene_type:complete